ncbi:MAG: CDP-alcohol phosphatidyltransferase family protein [Candidatus Accumulibacter sp.]|jgi:CDP-diacylglycerol--glycerol-3-phosphate 3-phosphatidyltransferase|nr:CDP-alcohol phosphatidyltransferase family protein [Accumulibacter sp.]
MISLYRLKPAFQNLLRPLVRRLAAGGVTANGVTLLAMIVSLLLGLWLHLLAGAVPALYLIVPPWMLLRMALNAVDGMLAREFGQKTPLGAYLNELSDVVSDAALYLPFAWVPPFGGQTVGLVIVLAAVSEMAGALGPMVGAPRRYDGPLGKSDRAALFGALGLWAGLAGGSLPAWTFWILGVLAPLAIVLNIVNRIRGGLADAAAISQGETHDP